MSEEKRVAVFADLANPKVSHYTPEQISEGLEGIARDGFTYFSPKNVGYYFLANMAKVYNDSEYGVRVDLAKKIIAAALYSGSEVTHFFRNTALQYKQQVDDEVTLFQSKKYTVIKSLKLIPEKVRRQFGRERKNLDAYVTGEQEQKSLAKKRVIVDTYTTLANSTEEIIAAYGKKDISAIIDLVEINHLFSKEKNGTAQDISFTDPLLRKFGAILQQQIHRIWYNCAIEDSPQPLLEEGVIPVQK
jgi:hypothetical protein